MQLRQQPSSFRLPLSASGRGSGGGVGGLPAAPLRCGEGGGGRGRHPGGSPKPTSRSYEDLPRGRWPCLGPLRAQVMLSSVGAEVDFIEELRLRRWAREHYVPGGQRKLSWHPVVLDEMARKDHDLERVSLQ